MTVSMKETSSVPGRAASVEDVEANVLYLLVLATELLLRDCSRRISESSNGTARFGRGQASKFKWMLAAARDFIVRSGQLLDDVDLVSAARGFEDYDLFRESANELARLVLLFADRSAVGDNTERVFALLREMRGEGIIDDKALGRFMMR